MGRYLSGRLGAGAGADTVFGSTGDDVLVLRDGVSDGANGSTGFDTATVDRGVDVLSLVESVR